jgi:aspartate kinase
MIVQKFGGTSVQDAPAMQRVAGIVQKALDRKVLVVLSACAGVTNTLFEMAQDAEAGKVAKVKLTLERLQDRHRQLAIDLLADTEQFLSIEIKLTKWFHRLETFANAITVTRELTPRAKDYIVSFGERCSSLLFAGFLESLGVSCVLADARKFLITDTTFTAAVPLFDRSQERINAEIRPLFSGYSCVITQGFIGSTEDGLTSTIGRGGSDYSAAIFASLLEAEELQIWTDTDGILTADPTIVKTAKNIREMTFQEASELAYFGARVLHPNTILPAVQKKIPVRVLNSHRPDSSGTLIVGETDLVSKCVVKSIAYKEGITLINIVSTRMFMAHGFLENVFDVFHKYQTVVHTVATSEVNVSATIDTVRNLDEIVKELSVFSNVTASGSKAIVCVVGENLKNIPGVTASVFMALGDTNINMISQGASEINLSFVIDESEVESAINRLHGEFFSNTSNRKDLFEMSAPGNNAT